MGGDALDLTVASTHHLGEWRPHPPQDVPPTPVSAHWIYEGSDPALMLFTAAMRRFNLTFPSHATILELGCAESDWLERMHRLDPTLSLTGVDARRQERQADGFRLLQGSAMEVSLFEPESFDRVVLLGALEHFGLGFYGDPVHEAGDTLTMINVGYWLKPGGFVYFDVPCQPTSRIAENRHFRMYSPRAIGVHLVPQPLQEINRGYSLPEPHAGMWCHEPTVDRVPYWFAAVVAQKV